MMVASGLGVRGKRTVKPGINPNSQSAGAENAKLHSVDSAKQHPNETKRRRKMSGKKGKKSGPSKDVLSTIGTINTILPRAEVKLSWVVGSDPDDVVSQHYELSWNDPSAVYNESVDVEVTTQDGKVVKVIPPEFRQTATTNKATAKTLLESMFLKSPAVVDLKMAAVVRETVALIMSWQDKYRDQFALALAAAVEAEEQDSATS